MLFTLRPATALRLVVAAAMLLALAGLSAVLATEASAGAVGKVTVNSLSNIDDGDCEGPPNDQAVGNCTFHEAIDQVNAGWRTRSTSTRRSSRRRRRA